MTDPDPESLAEFGASTDELTETVVRAWSAGEVSTAAAAEVIGTTLAGLVRYASIFGVPLLTGVTITVEPADISDSIADRLRLLADEASDEDVIDELQDVGGTDGDA